jgi:hypothetical protein
MVSFLLVFPPKSDMHSTSPHSCCMPYPSHPLWLGHSNYTWRSLQVMKLLIMQFSSTFRHFISLRSKSYPQHSVLKHNLFKFISTAMLIVCFKVNEYSIFIKVGTYAFLFIIKRIFKEILCQWHFPELKCGPSHSTSSHRLRPNRLKVTREITIEVQLSFLDSWVIQRRFFSCISFLAFNDKGKWWMVSGLRCVRRWWRTVSLYATDIHLKLPRNNTRTFS